MCDMLSVAQRKADFSGGGSRLGELRVEELEASKETMLK